MVAPSIQPVLRGETAWTIWDDGEVDLRLAVRRAEGFPSLPRLGLRLFLPEAMRQVSYYGLGPLESYADKRRASCTGSSPTTSRPSTRTASGPRRTGAGPIAST